MPDIKPDNLKIKRQDNLAEQKLVQETILSRLHHKFEEKEASAVAKKLDLPYLDLSIIPLDAEAVTTIPEKVAREAQIAIISKIGKKLRIATCDPINLKTKEVLAKLEKDFGYSYKLFFVSPTSLERAWERYKASTLTALHDQQALALSEEELTEFEKGIRDISQLKQRITEVPITEVLNIIIAGGIKTDASDIHLEPKENEIRLRYRIDGVLQDITFFPKKIYNFLLSRIKMLAKMKLNIHNIPQNGRFSILVGQDELDIRVAILPGNFGEDIVMRLLTKKGEMLEIDTLGLREETADLIRRQLAKPNGMILSTGPTGSGKTTTLYAFLKELNDPETKVITIEDPIEYHLEGISQTQVKTEEGYTFATGLPAILRQDPDVIMVGEIRDADTANIAIQAALTGHIVLSTLHTNNAAGAIPRLIELAVRPTLIPSAINCVIAQRLVRRLCQNCKEAYQPAPETVEALKKILAKISTRRESNMKIPQKIDILYRSKGCPKCSFIGFRGRVGLFEILIIDRGIEKLITEQAPASEIHETAVRNGMLTMNQDGILKAIEGITSLDEIERVSGGVMVEQEG